MDSKLLTGFCIYCNTVTEHVRQRDNLFYCYNGKNINFATVVFICSVCGHIGNSAVMKEEALKIAKETNSIKADDLKSFTYKSD